MRRTSNVLLAVTWTPNQFVAVGTNGELMSSSSGFVWATQSSGVTNTLRDICFGRGALTAVGEGGSIVTSADGTNWIKRISGTSAQLNAVAYGHGSLVAVGNGGTILESGAVTPPPLRELVGLSVFGPETLESGISASYRCLATYTDGSSEDVSRSANTHFLALSHEGIQLETARFFGNTFYAETTTNTEVFLVSSTHHDSTGGRAANPIAVTLTAPFSVQISARIEGVHFIEGFPIFHVLFQASSSGALDSAMTFNWDIGDDDGEFNNGSGEEQSIMLPGGRTYLIGVKATQSSPLKAATARFYFALNKGKQDAQEPDTWTVPDIIAGTVKNSRNAELIQADLAKAKNGLIVLIHGFCAAPTNQWLSNMASAIELRLFMEHVPAPAVVLYDWKEMADPDCFRGRSPSCPASFSPSRFFDIKDDLWTVRSYGIAQGHILADWIKQRLDSGTIARNATIHLIGHSAGGFVAGECATVLKQMGILVHQTTMLDTPHPFRRHIEELRNPQRVERYISSCFGESAPEVDATGCSDAKLDQCPGLLQFLNHKRFPCQTIVQPDVYYRRQEVASNPSPDLVEAHEYSHEWYSNSIANISVTNGFWYSPWLGHSFPEVASIKSREAAVFQEIRIPLEAFNSFGAVIVSNGNYIIQEEANAGIFTNIAIPIGAERLRFRYRFVQPGDGDFLTVQWSTNVLLYVGLAATAGYTNYISTEVAIPFGGETDTLTFKLVSRGATNAVVIIRDVALSINPDPDGDTLLTDLEGIIGTDPLISDSDGDGISDAAEIVTNPLQWDTDGDGVSDGEELRIGTDPTHAESTFRLKSIAFARPSTVNIEWSGPTNKTYQVNRSTAPDKRSYTTLTNGAFGMVPDMRFVDDNATNAMAFYWIGITN